MILRRWGWVGVLCVTSTLHATDGNTVGEFLLNGVGARAAAMGDAQVAIPEGALSIYWNPAGLGALDALDVSLSHNRGIEDVVDQNLSVAYPTKRWGAFALGFRKVSVDDFLTFDEAANNTGSASSGDNAISLGWGRPLIRGRQPGTGLFGGLVGTSVKEEVAGISANGFTTDVGLLWRPSGRGGSAAWVRRLSLGVSARHLGGGLTYDSQKASFPREFVWGIAHAHVMAGDVWTNTVDLKQTAGDSAQLSLGTEYWYKGRLALRAGFRTSEVDGAGLRAGLGTRLGNINVDYAWSAMGDALGSAHRLTLGYRWGAPTLLPGTMTDLFDQAVARGRKNMDLKLYDRAILDFNEALSLFPEDAGVRALLLECGKRLEGGAPL